MLKSSFATSSSLLAACSVLSLGIGAQVAFAQPVDDTSSQASGEAGEIVVTATRRAESIQDVPATIAAFSQKDLEDRKVEGLDDLITQVPSLNVGKTFGSNVVTLRGISTNSTSGFEDASVAIHVNGVYQPRAHALDIALLDLERIEVLSGPQGTLYGRNATGGVINYILRRPTQDTEAEITGTIGNYNSYGLNGYVSGPISDTVGFRIAGLWDNQDKGFIKNVAPGAIQSRIGANQVVAIRGVLAFEPIDTLQIDLEGSFSSTNSAFSYTALAPSLNAVRQAQMGVQPFSPRKVASNFPAHNDTKTYAASATIRWDISDNVKLSSISAYQKYDNNFHLDNDTSAGTLQEVPQRYDSDTFTQELNLNAETFDNRLSSIFGIYYFHDNVSGSTQIFGNPFGGPYAQYFNGDNTLRTRSIAFFTDQTLRVIDRLRLIGGLRYNVDKKKTMNQLTSCGTPAPILETDQKFKSWTPKVGGQFDVTKDIMFYGNWQEGVKAGGVALGTCANAFEPETIEGFEVGLKTQFLDNRVRLNIAGYWYDYGNLQVQKTLGTAGGFTVQNAASAKIKGIEGNLDAAITDRLRLNVAAMVQSAKYTDFINCNNRAFLGACSAADPRPLNDPTRFQQLSGNWLNRAAPWSINLGLQYTFDVGGGELMLRGESYWSGKVHYSEFDAPALTQDAYSLQNAFVTYTPEGKKFEFRLFAKNIGQKEHFASAFFNGFTAQDSAVWAEPRTFGAAASVRF